MSIDTKTVKVNRARVYMTAKEYQMLELLALRKGTTLTKESFLNHLYGGMNEPEMKIIDVYRDGLGTRLRNTRALGECGKRSRLTISSRRTMFRRS